MSAQPKVVLIGRINVGKSSLFNRLTETTGAIVSRQPGTTRDYNIAPVRWQGKQFDLIDTGGVNIDQLKNSIKQLLPGKRKSKPVHSVAIDQAIINQTKAALEQADTVLLIVDAHVGLLPEDQELAKILKQLGKKTFLVANKSDNQKIRNTIHEFQKLGLGEPLGVSASSGSGTGDLLDSITESLEKIDESASEIPTEELMVSIIGRPNVGKSSLLNQLTASNRVIVSDEPNTTRDPQHSTIHHGQYDITFIDTAGLRQRGKITGIIDHFATRKTLQTMSQAPIALLVTEVNQPLTNQDARIGGLLKEGYTSVIVVANKWDLVPDKTQKTAETVTKYYQRFFPHLHFAPIIFTSALDGKNVQKIFDLVISVWEERNIEIPDETLKALLQKIIQRQKPRQARGPFRPVLESLKQTRVNPPTFELVIRRARSLHFSYIRFIENQIREQHAFMGTPIKLKIISNAKQ